MEKYGFVYIWYDHKHKRFYIGSHWGTDYDGYVSSSDWVCHSHRRRPQDFKRRIIEKVYTNKRDTRLAEQKWLDLVEESELGVKYYNRTKKVGGIDSNAKGISEEARQKMREAKLGKSNPHKGKTLEELHGSEKAEEVRRRLSQSHQGQVAWNRGKENLKIQGENHHSFGKPKSDDKHAKYMREYRAKRKKMPNQILNITEEFVSKLLKYGVVATETHSLNGEVVIRFTRPSWDYPKNPFDVVGEENEVRICED